MFTPSHLQEISARVAAIAARQNKIPYMVWPRDLDEPLYLVCKRIPNIGSYRPQGWELLEAYFVDKSDLGLAVSGEEAVLTMNEFCRKIESGFGYAVVEEGPFQILVGKFKRIWP